MTKSQEEILEALGDWHISDAVVIDPSTNQRVLVESAAEILETVGIDLESLATHILSYTNG